VRVGSLIPEAELHVAVNEGALIDRYPGAVLIRAGPADVHGHVALSAVGIDDRSGVDVYYSVVVGECIFLAGSVAQRLAVEDHVLKREVAVVLYNNRQIRDAVGDYAAVPDGYIAILQKLEAVCLSPCGADALVDRIGETAKVKHYIAVGLNYNALTGR